MPKINYYEYKYFVSNEKVGYIESVLNALSGDLDPFPKGVVDSVYYDSLDRRCYAECRDGNALKRKFRIRGYGDGTFSQLHYKQKDLFGVGKYKAKIDQVSMVGPDAPAWDEIFPSDRKDSSYSSICSIADQYGGLLPTIRVRYQRHRYRIYDYRLTLDTHIEVSGPPNGIRTLVDSAVLPYHVLEVKTPDLRPKLPLLGLVPLPQVSFSKFFLGLNTLNKIVEPVR